MGDCVDRELSRSKRDSDIETQRARQAHYLSFCIWKEIVDPCDPTKQQGWPKMLAIYAKYVIGGDNFTSLVGPRAQTLRGYLNAVNDLFARRKVALPIVLKDKTNPVTVILSNLEVEEDVAKQRSPLTPQMYTELLVQAKKSKSIDEIQLLAWYMTLGRILGPRPCEWCQKTQRRVEIHTYPSGTKVVKAWCRVDFEFFDSQGTRITEFTAETRLLVKRVRIRWKIQKNRQNGQKVTVVRYAESDDLCPVLAAWDIYMHSIEIGQSADMPMAATLDNKKELKYITATRVADVLRKIAKKVHPNCPPDDIKRYSAHSVRVWACVLLDEAGQKPSFIQKRLRWLGDSYKIYLRDTQAINEQHRDALKKASKEVQTMLAQNLDVLPDECNEEVDMGDYIDFAE